MRRRSRLTITLSKTILKKIDSFVDGKKIRNRSHAIEFLVSESLTSSINEAVILAGGKYYTKKHPFLLEVNGQNLFNFTVDHLKKFGIQKVVLCLGKYRKELKDKLGGESSLGVDLEFVGETKKLGTAGVLKKAVKYLSGKPFFVLHGDVLTDLNLERLAKFHADEKPAASMVVKLRLAEKKYGKVVMQGNKIVEFVGATDDRGISVVNGGVYIFNPDIVDYIPNKTPSYLEKDVFPKLAKQGKLSAYIYQGTCFDVSRPDSYKKALKQWRGIKKGRR